MAKRKVLTQFLSEQKISRTQLEVCAEREMMNGQMWYSVDWNKRKISKLQIASIIRLAASTSEREKESQSSLVATMKRMPKSRSKDDQ